MYEQQQQPPTAIALTMKYWWLTFVFAMIKPFVTVNGHPVHAGWGRTVIPVPPGQHHVHVHVPYVLPSQIGKADTMVPVHPGQVVEVEYRAPAIGWLDGSIGPAPQKFRGVAASLALIAVPLVLLLCVCGGLAVTTLMDSGTDDTVTLPQPVDPLPTTLDPLPTPVDPLPTGFVPDRPGAGKPTLREAPARSLVGPTFSAGEDTYTMDFTGWPFAFRTPGSWGCVAGKVPLPDAKAWVCIDEGDPGNGQRLQVMLRPCEPCGAADQKKLTTAWFDKGAKGRVHDARTSYVETPRDAKGRYTLDMSHFFPADAPKWQVGVGAFSPPAAKADIQKIFNDVLTQTG